MAKHIVLGAGNLGFDLTRSLTNAGHDALCLSRNNKTNQFSYPISQVSRLAHENPDVIWCTIGAGSVDAAKSNFIPFIDLHVRLVTELIQTFSKTTKLVFFSTDYAANEKYPNDPMRKASMARSLYSLSKIWMEQLIEATRSENVKAVRVGTLYGAFKKEQTFPGKVIANNKDPGKVYFPTNMVTPTPTWWVADTLVKNFDKMFNMDIPIVHCAPSGNISVANWAKCILGKEYEVIGHGLDYSRPPDSNLGCTLTDRPPMWNVLWNDNRNPFYGEDRCIV